MQGQHLKIKNSCDSKDTSIKVLNNAFCTNSICVPSRATIMTGQFSNRNGVYTLSDAFSPDSVSIAKVLQANGYQTALIGKWHV